MKMRPIGKKFMLGAMALAGVVCLGGFALAAGPHGGHGAHGKGQDMFCKHLGCSEEQSREIAEIHKQLQIDLEAEHVGMNDFKRLLAEEFKKEDPNERRMKRVYRDLAKRQAAIRDRQHDALMEVHGVLTAEQRVKAADHIVGHSLMMGGHHGKGMKGHGHHGKGKDGECPHAKDGGCDKKGKDGGCDKKGKDGGCDKNKKGEGDEGGCPNAKKGNAHGNAHGDAHGDAK